MAKTQLISLRLNTEDVEILAKLGKEYGNTTSQKIRSLINKAASTESKAEHFVSAKDYTTQLFSKARRAVETTLVDANQKSEVFELYDKWLTNESAYYQTLESLSEEKLTVDEIERIERRCLDEILGLLEKVYSLGLSTRPRVINNRYFLDGLNSLSKLVKTVEKFHTEKDV